MRNIFCHIKRKNNSVDSLFLEAVGSLLSHELRTPLVTIKAGSSAIKDSLLDLFNKDCHNLKDGLNNKQKNLILNSLVNIEKEASVANFFVGLVSFILRVDSKQKKSVPIELYKVLADAINRLPERLKGLESKFNITQINKNIKVNADYEILMMMVCGIIYDVIQRKSIDKEINIIFLTEYDKKKLLLDIIDDGIPVDLESSSNELHKTYTKNGELKLGFCFCKKTMEQIDGAVDCFITDDRKTTYRLIFTNWLKE